MQTLTPEQYKAKYGNTGVWTSQVSQTSQEPNLFGRIANTLKTAGTKEANIFEDTGNNSPSQIPRKATEAVATAFNVIPQVTTDILPKPARQVIGAVSDKAGQVVNWLADKLGSTKLAQDFVTKHPEVANALGEITSTASNLGQISGDILAADQVAKGAQKTVDLTKQGAQKTGEVIGNVMDNTKSAFNSVKEKINPTITTEEQLLKDATPDYNKKLIGQPNIKNPDGTIVPRVQEGGLIKGRIVNATPLEQEAANELAKVPGYPVEGTSLEKYQSIQPEIAKRGEELMSSLEKENILRPPQQIRKVISSAINNVPEESLLLQKSDPVISNYMRVANNAIEQADGTLAGELRVKQLLDAAYKNARGKMAFGSDKLSALDDIHTAARDALTQDLISKAIGTDVKASLKAQWDLFRVSDVLKAKAEAEAGNSIGRFQQKYPVTTKLIKGVSKVAGTVAGVGTVVH